MNGHWTQLKSLMTLHPLGVVLEQCNDVGEEGRDVRKTKCYTQIIIYLKVLSSL